MEELKRQCEIRKLPYTDVKYLITEILLELQAETEKIKGCRFGCYCKLCALCDEDTHIHCGDCVMQKSVPITVAFSSLITEHIKRIEE
jgi:hypothetical protein